MCGNWRMDSAQRGWAGLGEALGNQIVLFGGYNSIALTSGGPCENEQTLEVLFAVGKKEPLATQWCCFCAHCLWGTMWFGGKSTGPASRLQGQLPHRVHGSR